MRTTKVLPTFLVIVALLAVANPLAAATWTPLTNKAPQAIELMVQLTDGTVLVHGYSNLQGWMKLTPDATGSYINGTWTTLAQSSTPRLYFASQVLTDGRFWITGGEYTGPGAQANWGNTGEIYDPVANTWTSITPFPAQSHCPSLSYVTGNLALGSPTITNIYPYTTGLTVGEGVSGKGIPAGTTILSINSSTSLTMSANATAAVTASTVSLSSTYQLLSCVGDEPSALLPNNRILLGDLVSPQTWIYDVTADAWTPSGSKTYTDQSDEEGWAKLPNGNLITYDLFKSSATGEGFAEIYNVATGTWSGISPGDGTASGTIPALSSSTFGYELGPVIRLQDGRIFVIGATQHTALYNPTTNTWAAGPDTMGTLNGISTPFGSDDAPAAIVPNGHVIFAADAAPSRTVTTGAITTGSTIITNIPSTAIFQKGWPVSGTGIPSGSTISSVDSASQIHINSAATATNTSATITVGGTFSGPTQLFDFNPTTNAINAVSPALSDTGLSGGAYPKRMLMLPTGQLMFSDSSSQAYIYTPDGNAGLAFRPAINSVAYNGSGVFTLTGKQLNGQSAGAAYGDDDQMDSNYPIVRFVATDGSGSVYYARTTNWSSVAVAGGTTASETVNLTLNPSLTTPGNYAVVVSGAGISSLPLIVNITQSEINKQ